MAIHNPDALRVPKVLTQQLAALLGKAPCTVRAWVERGILPQPEVLGPKTHLHDVAAVLKALASRVRWGEDGYAARKARAALRRARLAEELAVAPAPRADDLAEAVLVVALPSTPGPVQAAEGVAPVPA